MSAVDPNACDAGYPVELVAYVFAPGKGVPEVQVRILIGVEANWGCVGLVAPVNVIGVASAIVGEPPYHIVHI